MDYAAAGLLDGLEGDALRARRQLLDRLLAAGFTPAEVTAAAAENRLALLPVDRVLGGRYTAREIEAKTDTPAELMLQIRRLLGLPRAGADDPVFGDPDVGAAAATKRFLDAGLDVGALSEITRVLGEGMARLAMTTAVAFADSFLQPGDSEVAVAARFATLAEELLPPLGPVLVAAFTAHLRESVSRGMIGRAELATGQISESQNLTICFADLVGFTRLGGVVEVEELGSVAGALADLAVSVTTPQVRLVKTIGDAAMFVSAEPEPLVAAALALVDAVERAELPSLRAGLAFGPTFQRGGDYFGHSVNLASRVTGVARPGSVLCTTEIHDAIPAAFDWSYAGRHRLKGVPEPVPCYRARPPQPQSDADADAAEPPTAVQERRSARRARRREADRR